MKTAEQILFEVTEYHTGTGYTAPCLIEAMKEYAKRVARQTLIKASTRVYSESTRDMGVKESIRSTPIVTP